jgi:hypothetical protein
MARKVPKRDYGQATGGWSPFASSAPTKPVAHQLCRTCDGARTFDAYDRVRDGWFTYSCPDC